MNNLEYHVAVARKLGMTISFLCPYVGTTVRASGNSARTYVDAFGDGVASAPGVKGDHFRKLHDRCVTLMVSFLFSIRLRFRHKVATAAHAKTLFLSHLELQGFLAKKMSACFKALSRTPKSMLGIAGWGLLTDQIDSSETHLLLNTNF